MRPCPMCGCETSYALKTRKIYRCTACAHDFTETSKTIWASPKMPADKRAEIIRRLGNSNPRRVSIEMGVDYKTAWNIAKKLKIEAAS